MSSLDRWLLFGKPPIWVSHYFYSAPLFFLPGEAAEPQKEEGDIGQCQPAFPSSILGGGGLFLFSSRRGSLSDALPLLPLLLDKKHGVGHSTAPEPFFRSQGGLCNREAVVSIPDFLPPSSSSYSRRVQTPLLTTFFSLFFRSPLRRRRRTHKNGGSNIRKRSQPPWAGVNAKGKEGTLLCKSTYGTVFLCSNTFLTWNKSREERAVASSRKRYILFIW